VAGCCEYGDEPSSSGATKLVSYNRVLIPVSKLSPSAPDVISNVEVECSLLI
jgi:hypothetical protein